MWSIAKRELRFFFSHLIGYLVIASYLLVSTLILWFFDTPYNLLSIGFGDLSPFFELTPWLFLFLIPALSMRSFSEERSSGTFELLLTKPLSPTQIFSGKLLGIGFVLLVTILPTFLHLIALDSLLEPNSTLDWGRIMGSYMSLMALALLFLTISLCSSLLFSNQVSAFLVALIGCFTQFYLWGALANYVHIAWLYKWISDLGIQTHYLSLSRGIILLDDLLYFVGFSIAFFLLGIELIKKEQR